MLLSGRPVRPVSGFTSVATAGSDVVAGADVSVSKSFCFLPQAKSMQAESKTQIAAAESLSTVFLFISKTP